MNDQTGTPITWESLVRFQRELSVLEGKSGLFLSAAIRGLNRQGITEQEEAHLAALQERAHVLYQALSLAARTTRDVEVVLRFMQRPTPSYTPDGRTAKDLPST